MIVLRDIDPADKDRPVEKLLLEGKVIKGITLALEDDIDLALVCRNQKMVREAVDGFNFSL